MRARLLQLVAGLLVAFSATEAQADKKWAGIYFGAHVVHNSLNASGQFDTFGGTPHVDFGALDLKGFGIGAQLGYNYQMGNFVFGIEGDIQSPGVKDSFRDGETDVQTLKLNSLATVRGRLGYAFDSILVYGTAGIGFVNGKLIVENGVDTFTFNQQAFVFGGGAEYMFMPNVTLRLEYLRYDLGKNFTDQLVALSDGDPGDNLNLKSIDSVRFSVNWKFN